MHSGWRPSFEHDPTYLTNDRQVNYNTRNRGAKLEFPNEFVGSWAENSEIEFRKFHLLILLCLRVVNMKNGGTYNWWWWLPRLPQCVSRVLLLGRLPISSSRRTTFFWRTLRVVSWYGPPATPFLSGFFQCVNIFRFFHLFVCNWVENLVLYTKMIIISYIKVTVMFLTIVEPLQLNDTFVSFVT
jgi:hypothetical protein